MAPQRAVDECTLAFLIQVVHLEGRSRGRAQMSIPFPLRTHIHSEAVCRLHSTAKRHRLTLQLVFLDSMEPLSDFLHGDENKDLGLGFPL